MNAAFPHRDEQPETWAPSGERLAHALKAAGFGDDEAAPHAAAASLFNKTGSYLEIRAEFGRARHCYERAVRIAEATYSHNGSSRGDAGTPKPVMLGLDPSIQSDPSIRAVVGPRVKPEDDSNVVDPTLAIYLNNLGYVLREQGDLAGAKAHFERALRIDEQAHGPDHPSVARDVNNLGDVLQDLGDLAGAKAHYERALRIDEQAYGPDHPNVATGANNLGDVLREQGDLAGAKAHFERALGILERFLGPDHPNTRTVRDNLAAVERAMGT